MTATQINKESEKNPNEISTNTSQDLEDETSINGKKSTKKHKGETTYKRQHLSRYGKKTCEFLNQVGVTKVDISFKKKSQSLATKKNKLQDKNKIRNLKDLYKNAKLNNSKSGAVPQTSPFFDDIKSRYCRYPRKERSWICKTDERAGNDMFRWCIIFFDKFD